MEMFLRRCQKTCVKHQAQNESSKILGFKCTTATYLSKPRCLGCTLPTFCATCSAQLCRSCRSGKRINSDYNDPVKGIETTRNWESWLNLFVICLVNSLLVICCGTRSWSTTRKSCRFPKTKVDPFHFCTIGVCGWF